jgi:hypothetical protein
MFKNDFLYLKSIISSKQVIFQDQIKRFFSNYPSVNKDAVCFQLLSKVGLRYLLRTALSSFRGIKSSNIFVFYFSVNLIKDDEHSK